MKGRVDGVSVNVGPVTFRAACCRTVLSWTMKFFGHTLRSKPNICGKGTTAHHGWLLLTCLLVESPISLSAPHLIESRLPRL